MHRLLKYLCLALLHGPFVSSAPQGTVAPGPQGTGDAGLSSGDGDPPIFANTKRYTYNCDTTWMKQIESQAWADAGVLANEAVNWVPGKQYQPLMDLFMGKDSTMSQYQSIIKRGLRGEVSAHRPSWVWNSVISVYCGDAKPINGVRRKVCDKNVGGRRVKPFASAWIERGSVWNNYYIVLCPRFFAEKDSLDHTLAQMNTGLISKTNASAYKFTWGHTYYHELMHLDPVVAPFESKFAPLKYECE
ncbi:hypothetical protein GP486_001775 [Trichoglossum hirsutum]|uniref:Lysine-specific metallo-endopeptidase domain-containing protein n=1 Tax=Trichoglossum hirsutum TaxID=265104 RepID=A0A9P8LG78_9PEZI|nr:hypothetical protein GP486_001775 [Trichoglossum hirsutum]